MLKVKVDYEKVRNLIEFYFYENGKVDLHDYSDTDGLIHLAAACLAVASNSINEDGESWHDEEKFQSATSAIEKMATIMVEAIVSRPDDTEVTGQPKDGILQEDEWSARRCTYCDPEISTVKRRKPKTPNATHLMAAAVEYNAERDRQDKCIEELAHEIRALSPAVTAKYGYGQADARDLLNMAVARVTIDLALGRS